MLESLNYSFRNPKKHNLSNLPHQRVEKLQKNHGVLRGPQLGKQLWRSRLGILRVKSVNHLCTLWRQMANPVRVPLVLNLGILYNQRDATYTMFFIIIRAVHVSGGFSAHYKELIKLHVQSWVSSNPPTPAADSRKAWQYQRLHMQFYKLLMMGEKNRPKHVERW